ncbi:MAG TPA: hypothetical protein VJN88_01115 [Ktedonobacterales bacterium]|nr:hypothetical protein [Ktedonobacterales bacterium]
MSTHLPHLRVFLDTGVIIQGLKDPRSASFKVLRLLRGAPNLTLVLAEAVEGELQDFVDTLVDTAQRQTFVAAYEAFLNHVFVERVAEPTEDEQLAAAPTLLPAIRHAHDIAPVLSAIKSAPDWILSVNTRHWGAQLAAQTGLRVGHPNDFLEDYAP